jgi:hypothetical protein
MGANNCRQNGTPPGLNLDGYGAVATVSAIVISGKTTHRLCQTAFLIAGARVERAKGEIIAQTPINHTGTNGSGLKKAVFLNPPILLARNWMRIQIPVPQEAHPDMLVNRPPRCFINIS